MKEIRIIGCGMAGLLAANMLRSKAKVTMYDLNLQLPNNHHAVLRFRSEAISEATGIPFRKVRMIRASLPYLNPVAAALAYSYKCNGEATSDRSINSGVVEGDRYVAPEDFIEQLHSRLLVGNVEFNFGFNAYNRMDEILAHSKGNKPVVISTMPMSVLMGALNYPGKFDIDFNSQSGWVIKAKLNNVDAFVSLYDPRPYTRWSRASITGDELAIEFPRHEPKLEVDSHWRIADASNFWNEMLTQFGLAPEQLRHDTVTVKKQPYAKIIETDNEKRLAFTHWATDKFNIYSLGRFATWRPGLLMDDLVNDIRLIDRWTDRKSLYDVSNYR